MKKDVFVIIMAGGVGSRFWPSSREKYPKQFLDILGTGKSLLQNTFHRFDSWVPPSQIFVLTHKDYSLLVEEQLPNIPTENILTEPARRNTAPCLAYVAFKINKISPDATLIIVPSDHLILKQAEFLSKLEDCIEAANTPNALITLGIQPTRPDTGYGYIQYDTTNNGSIAKVKRFTEKPDLPTAELLLQSGDHVWNAGIFVWKTSSILRAFMHLMPAMYQIFERGIPHYGTDSENQFMLNHYHEAESISIDFAILEKSPDVFTCPADIGWSDLGTWSSVHSQAAHDPARNAILSGLVKIQDASGNVVHVEDEHKIVVINGLHDFVIVDTNDALLIWPKDKEQEIKQLTNYLAEQHGNKYL